MSRTIGALPPADQALERLRGRRAMVFLDYDGTLTGIVDDPARADLDEATREVLKRLAGVTPTVVVSGRDTADVRGRVAVDGIVYAGSHGFDITTADGTVVDDSRGQPYLPALDRAQADLEAALAGVGGADVDRKRYAIAVHHRRVAPDAVPGVETIVDRVLAEHPQLRKGGGKKVFELRPDVDWHKGTAVLRLLDVLGDADAVPVYVGDDVTDEDAFEAIRGRGIGVVVRGEEDRETGADYALDDPAAVRDFLARIVALARPDPAGS